MDAEYPQYMHSKQLNAPQMTGAEGAEGQILQVLDACLTTGFNPQTVATATIDGEEIKLDFGVMHGYEVLQHITISGGSSSELNARHRILKVTGTTVTIAKGMITSVAGTLTTKISPLNWENMFGVSDTKRRAYRSKDVTSKKQILFLDCNYPAEASGGATNPFKGARVSVCESMEVLGVQGNSLTDAINAPSTSGLLHWFQKVTSTFVNNTESHSTPWLLVGDGKIFYFLVGWGSYSSYTTTLEEKAIYMFGELPKLSENDRYNSVLVASHLNPNSYTSSTQVYNSYRGSFLTEANANSVATGAFYLQDISGAARMEPVMLAALTGTSNNGGTQHSGAVRTDAMTPVHPLTLGFALSNFYFVRQGSKSFGAPLPYLRFVCADVSSFGETLDRTIRDGVLYARCASQYASQYNQVYYAHVGFNLVNPRPKDFQL